MFPTSSKLFVTTALLLAVAGNAVAQDPARDTSTSATSGSGSSKPEVKSAPVNPKYTTSKSPLDTAYGAKIAQYTTEKYFMTELVDHLPASDKIPSPEKVLGL